MLGKEAAVLVPTCSMGNLVSLMTLAERGTQVLLGSSSHIVTSEAWGVVSICALYPRVVEDQSGFPDVHELEAAIGDALWRNLPRTSVVCLENTHNNAGGVAVAPADVAPVVASARRCGAAIYVDGARLFNASVALNLPLHTIVEYADLVSVSLNKGLGAPFGAMLVGSGILVEAARANLRRLGGASIHQVGRWAAAAHVALEGWEQRLAVDHQLARELAERLALAPGVQIAHAERRTNIVLLHLVDARCSADALVQRLAERGVLVRRHSANSVRVVVHSAIDAADVEFIADAVVASAAGLERSVGWPA